MEMECLTGELAVTVVMGNLDFLFFDQVVGRRAEGFLTGGVGFSAKTLYPLVGVSLDVPLNRYTD